MCIITKLSARHIQSLTQPVPQTDETRNGHRNENRDPKWSSRDSFQRLSRKETWTLKTIDSDFHPQDHFECHLPKLVTRINISFRKRATHYRALLRKVTNTDMTSLVAESTAVQGGQDA